MIKITAFHITLIDLDIHDSTLRAFVKGHSKKGMTEENLGQLQSFIKKLKKGELAPFKEKTARAKSNLRKAGLIK